MAGLNEFCELAQSHQEQFNRASLEPHCESNVAKHRDVACWEKEIGVSEWGHSF
jgi:hypothetical protein